MRFTGYFMFLFMFVVVIGMSAAFSASDTVLLRDEANIPRRSDGGLTKAESLLSKHKYAQAIPTLKDVIRRHPSNADAYTYLGYAHLQLEDTKRGIGFLKKALQLNPRHLGANQYLGQYYADNGKTSKALEQMQVIRIVCGIKHCIELDSLENAINEARQKTK